jgi:hypothetical protein
MLENEELGLKIAVDKEEAFWTEMKKKFIEMNANAKREIEMNEHLLKLCDEKKKVE